MISDKEMKLLYEAGVFNSIEYHNDRICKQEEIVKSSEARLKLALDKDKEIQENIKELDNIKKEIAELREHLKINK